MPGKDEFYSNFIDINDAINNNTQDDIDRWLYRIKFDSYAYVILPDDEREDFYILNGFNPHWRNQYTENQFQKIDPIIGKARDFQCPYIWNSMSLSVNDRFLNCAKHHGVRFGYSVSLPIDKDFIGVLSIARKNDSFISRNDSVSIIGMMSIYLQELNNSSRSYIRKMESEKFILPVLTKRELECLKWLAEGKTNWEISIILSVTERTVIFHITNCMIKLGAKNRVQAIKNAMKFKLIK